MAFKSVDLLTKSQVADLYELYQNEWWTKERSLEDVRVMVRNSSLIFGIVDDHEKLVAFCRVLTDVVFRATIYDVIVAESLRGQGLGRRLMDAVSQHAQLQRVSTLWLCCNPDKGAFYEKWGFRVFDEGQVWMLKAQREG